MKRWFLKALRFSFGVALVVSAACAPHTPENAPVSGSASASERTVFTDTALYRLHCLQADSGLTASSRRCTPRDQRVRVP